MPGQSSTRGLVALVLAVLLLTAAAVPGQAAESPLRLEGFQISVLPEYDTAGPNALVMFSGQLRNTSDTAYGGPIFFGLPGENPRVNSTCEVDAEGTHHPQPNSVSPRGDGTPQVSWSPSVAIEPGEAYSFHVEYYADLVEGGPAKTVRLRYLPDYPLDDLALLVVQPLRSSDYTADRAADNTGLSGEFRVHQYSFTGVEAGEPFEFFFGYTKADNEPSIEADGAGEPGGAGGSVEIDPVTETLLGAFVLVLAVLLFLVGTGRLGAGRSGRSASRGSRRGDDRGSYPAFDERQRARRLLLEGHISEQTYRMILAELRDERRKAK